jgi:hypothetical protein
VEPASQLVDLDPLGGGDTSQRPPVDDLGQGIPIDHSCSLWRMMNEPADPDEPVEGVALDPSVQYLFEGEILLQWQFVALSDRLLQQAISTLPGSEPAVWFALDAQLGALANISKIFWPRSDRAWMRNRGKALRKAFGMAENARLGDRGVRNALEHLDEDLGKWFRDSQRHNSIGRYLGPLPNPTAMGLQPGDLFRCYDPDSGMVAVMGEELDLPVLLREVALVVKEVDKLHRVVWWDRGS